MDEKQIHAEIQRLAMKFVLNNHVTSVEITDVVNESYLRTLEAKLPLTFNNLKKKLNEVCVEHKNETSKWNEDQIKHTDTSFCRKCKEDKPIAAFGITIRKKTGKKIIQTYCSTCQAEVMKLRYELNKEKVLSDMRKYQQKEDAIIKRKIYEQTPMYKQLNKERQKRFQENKRQKNIPYKNRV